MVVSSIDLQRKVLQRRLFLHMLYLSLLSLPFVSVKMENRLARYVSLTQSRHDALQIAPACLRANLGMQFTSSDQRHQQCEIFPIALWSSRLEGKETLNPCAFVPHKAGKTDAGGFSRCVAKHHNRTIGSSKTQRGLERFPSNRL